MTTSKTVILYVLLGLFAAIMLGGALLVHPVLFGVVVMVVGAIGAICCLDDLGYLESKEEKRKVSFNETP